MHSSGTDGCLSEIRFTIDGMANRDLFTLDLPVGIAVSDADARGTQIFRLARFELNSQHAEYLCVKHVLDAAPRSLVRR